MFDQRNQQFSTILLATTIMLSALVCCLAQGVLPAGSSLDQFIYNLYSVATSISVAFLFLCLVFCVEVMWRSSKFMYKRSKYNNGYLAKAIKKTKQMMGAIRGARIKNQNVADQQQQKESTSNSSRQNKIDARNIRTRNISKMTDTDIDKEFISYEHEINYYHTNREAMIDKSAYMVTADDGTMVESKSFEKFWRDSCSFYGNAAILSFYSGSAALFFSNVTFMWTVNLYMYRSLTSAKVCVIVILISLITSIVLLIYMRYVEKISMDNNVVEREAERERHSWGAFRAKMATLSSSRSESSFSLGFRGLSSLLGSSRRASEKNSSSCDDENRRSSRSESSNNINISNNGQSDMTGRGRGSGRGRGRGAPSIPLPIARSLETTPNFLGRIGESKSDSPPLPTADAEFPAVMFPAGVFDRG